MWIIVSIIVDGVFQLMGWEAKSQNIGSFLSRAIFSNISFFIFWLIYDVARKFYRWE
ncbi:hypothetical protein FC85_GL002494 [Lentilactobacillus diolivorans DSM 14421]|uniref:Uncharacterized protein n=1 Tax=Lentilactobacillus diolivorans DSM 14421 TaxID=1423739 RepID=A0A0R1SMP6_9LACO|nr:hypothetical protein FC85_GL002494 [Lentilactobacillus diolivorans DSM 14421]